jgi:hypothetical protein
MKNSRHLSIVASYPCLICGAPSEVHHIGGGGMGKKSPDSHTIPLCAPHHRTGGHGLAVHAGRKTWEANYGTEKELLYTFLCQLENDKALTEYALPALLKLRLKYG